MNELSQWAGLTIDSATAVAQLNTDLTATMLVETTPDSNELVASAPQPVTSPPVPESRIAPATDSDSEAKDNVERKDPYDSSRGEEYNEGEGELPVEVAEPSVLALFGIGALLLGLRLRRG